MATIQPIFPIEENASIFRVCVWLSPPHPPTITEKALSTKTRLVGTTSFIENKIINGAIFCQVDTTRPLENGSP